MDMKVFLDTNIFLEYFERRQQYEAVSQLLSAVEDGQLKAVVVYATYGLIDLRYYETKKWINYLAGLAIIIDPKGNMTFIPVRGLDSGVM